jgi:hypothetical protein
MEHPDRFGLCWLAGQAMTRFTVGGFDVSWRQIGCAILFSPILVGLLVFVSLVFVVKLPMCCCERCRAVRWLPYAGLVYYGLAVPLVLLASGLAWWEALILTGLFALGGDWLLPDPFTYVLNPRKRRAVKLAIEYVDAGEGPWPIYGMVGVVGSEASRTIISVAIKSGTRPPARRFLAVADETPSVEELDFHYVSTKHGVHAWM